MLDEKVVIIENTLIAADTYRMVLQGEITEEFKPGQFVNLEIEGYTLRRPISISSFDKQKKTFTLLYKVLGEGTQKMAEMKPGQRIKALGALGNGFPIEKAASAVLIGGGAGTGPLVQTAKELKEQGTDVKVVLGFPTKDDVYGEEDFEGLGITPYVSTDDGTYGFKGNAIDLIKAEGITGEIAYACGPKRMLMAVEETFERGYISLDIRMACGMGACMACVCKDKEDKDKYYRVCKEGPVFKIGQVEI
ncbi:MAG: dihydroorotate dehydrogenase electron transfer subunit [Firmicutes bacterium]|nr:dihydroorotate dehydrogenase electron transfer subunit [Bacillota bacterium]